MPRKVESQGAGCAGVPVSSVILDRFVHEGRLPENFAAVRRFEKVII
jgi:hypothetical protein